MNHGDYLRKILEEKKITQQAFGGMLTGKKGQKGVSRKYAIDLLNSEKLPEKRIEEINRILDIDIVTGSKEVDNVNEQQSSDFGSQYRIDMLKKDIEMLKEKIELKDKLIANYESRIKGHEDSFNEVWGMFKRLDEKYERLTTAHEMLSGLIHSPSQKTIRPKSQNK